MAERLTQFGQDHPGRENQFFDVLPDGGGEEGQIRRENQCRRALPAADPDLVDQLVYWERMRILSVKTQQRNKLPAKAAARRMLGWTPDLLKDERDKISLKAGKLVDGLLKQDADPDNPHELDVYLDLPRVTLPAAERLRKHVEKTMRELVRGHPLAEISGTIRGFGLGGLLPLAVLVGEIGWASADPNLPPEDGNYPHWRMIWKRCRAAPRDAYDHNINAPDKSMPSSTYGTLYGSIIQPLYNAQVRWEKDEDGKKTGELLEPLGPYGELFCRFYPAYVARYEAEGGKNPAGHAKQISQRRMFKRLVRDLWRAWNGQFQTDSHVEGA